MAIPNRFKVTTQDAYNYLASKYFTDQQLCIVLTLDGKLDAEAFGKALRLTLDLEPVLGCRFLENGGSPVWERRSDLNETKICSIIENPLAEDALQAFIDQPIHADMDALVSARIFRAQNRDTVCIKMNHSACDAGGLKEYVALLSKVYNVLAAGKKYPVEANSGIRDQSQILQNKDLKALAMRGFPQPTWTLPQKPGQQPLHASRVIRQKEMQAIVDYAKNRKATVNDMLLTALYRSLFAINHTAPDKPMLVQVSIDLRRYCPDGKAEAICNLSGALYVALECKADEPFEGTLQRVLQAMNRHKANDPGLASAAGLELMFSQGFAAVEKYMAQSSELGRNHKVTFPLLSNIGILGSYTFDELHTTECYITTPICYPPGFMLGATTFNGQMTLSVGYCGKENTNQINAFLEALIGELPTQ